MAEKQQPADLDALLKNTGPFDVSVSPQETTEDANHRRWKDKIIFLVAMFGLVALFLVSLYVLSFGDQTPEEKKIWSSILVSMISGLLGYALGKK